ncbi:hypothetical protein [Pseudomonas brassicacearum]|uniref:Uncharacterized protein n=1 Tax=Pseudomonas brassicacearum subsp. neoaurantiaca TaxID=494916 RepID=A0A7V8RJJ9_9PSED|nr:hypothetical protein [Pseudomonas brassicacearum]MBA1377698.1 hypothetical protein [Pseudomonas brassicacearum subsp. neoaurantiaca]
MRDSSNGVTSMCCETHKSFRRKIFKPNESNFRAQTKNVADGHRDLASMKIQRKTFIELVARELAPAGLRSSPKFINPIDQRLAAPHSIPYHPLLFLHRFPGSRLSIGAQSGKP